MWKLAATSAIVLAMASGATEVMAQAAQLQQQDQPRPEKLVRVIPAGELIDMDVVDRTGEEAGEIEYVMIDTRTDSVRWLVVESGGFLDIGDELVAIPWHAVDVAFGEDLRIVLDRGTLAQAPRITEDRLAELTDPAMVSSVLNYYTPSLKDQGREPVEPQQQAEADTPYLVVGRGLVTTVLPPAMRFTGEIEGTEVVTAEGGEVGNIDQLMIESVTGRIAYALVARGGFLGLGEEWVPVPFTALSFAPQARSYVLQTRADLAQAPGFPRDDDMAAVVSRDQLAELYQRYEAQPYWE